MRSIARFLVLLLAISTGMAHSDGDITRPSSDLTPEQVIHIVIDALKNNDPRKDDDGIATVFEFASPGNKQMTGPIQRFTRMIKGGFADMLNHVDSEFGDIDVKDNIALQAVWLTAPSGKQTGYVFQLGKQSGGEYDGMWMTDSVWPIGTREPEGQSI